MCEANAYLIKGEDQELLMEAVDTIEPEEEGFKLVNIFGEQKFIRASIHSMSLVDHKVFFKKNES